MAWNSDEEARVQIIEALLNEIQIALNNVATRAQMKQLLNLRQSEIVELQEQVETLQSEVVALQAFHL